MLLELDLFAGIEVLLGQTKVLPESGWGGARLRISPLATGQALRKPHFTELAEEGARGEFYIIKSLYSIDYADSAPS
jgi:hypothetical protein